MPTDTFQISGDHEWARWTRGVHCATCSANDGSVAPAVGIAIGRWSNEAGDHLEATPVCDLHAAYAEHHNAEHVAYFDPSGRMTPDLSCAEDDCAGNAHDPVHGPTIGICGHTGATYETLLAVLNPPMRDPEWGATIYLRDGRRIEGWCADVPYDHTGWEADCLPVRETEDDPAIWWIPFGMIAHIQIA